LDWPARSKPTTPLLVEPVELNFASPFSTRDDTWLLQPLLDINYGGRRAARLPHLVVLDEPGAVSRPG
jgi:hypothetical protein